MTSRILVSCLMGGGTLLSTVVTLVTIRARNKSVRREPMRIRLLAVAAATLTIIALGGCFMGEPFPEVAVRLQGSTVEVLYTDCQPAKLKSAKMISVTLKELVETLEKLRPR